MIRLREIRSYFHQPYNHDKLKLQHKYIYYTANNINCTIYKTVKYMYILQALTTWKRETEKEYNHAIRNLT